MHHVRPNTQNQTLNPTSAVCRLRQGPLLKETLKGTVFSSTRPSPLLLKTMSGGGGFLRRICMRNIMLSTGIMKQQGEAMHITPTRPTRTAAVHPLLLRTIRLLFITEGWSLQQVMVRLHLVPGMDLRPLHTQGTSVLRSQRMLPIPHPQTVGTIRMSNGRSSICEWSHLHPEWFPKRPLRPLIISRGTNGRRRKIDKQEIPEARLQRTVRQPLGVRELLQRWLKPHRIRRELGRLK